MGEFVATYATVLTFPVAAYDLKTAAAIAAATAKSRGWRLMSVQTAEAHKAEQEKK